MNHRYSLLALALMAASTACLKRSQPVVLHTLRPMASSEVRAVSANTMALEVMPVRIPDLVQRSQIVSAQGPERLVLSDTHRWGSPLDKEIQRVLAENIGTILASDSIVTYPHGEQVKAPWRLALELQRLEGPIDGQLHLQGTWTLTSVEGGQPLLFRRVRLQEPVQGKELDALVSAHSRILESLSREIAGELKNPGHPTQGS